MTTYAVADQVPPECDYITAGKEYRVIMATGLSFLIMEDDVGDEVSCDWINCPHLNGGNWRRVERD